MAGYTTRGYVADAEMANLQKTEAVARVTQGRKDYERLVAALDKVAAADVDLDRIRSDADRMRRSYESRLRKAAPLPVTLSRQQLPDAKTFSEKASGLSKKVAAYFLETPQFTTP